MTMESIGTFILKILTGIGYAGIIIMPVYLIIWALYEWRRGKKREQRWRESMRQAYMC